MNDTILLQQINAGSEYSEILKVTYPRHLEYARRHAMDYEVTYGNVDSNLDPRLGGWAKVALMLRSLLSRYRKVIWMDADSLIADMDADLREGCPAGIGCVVHKGPPAHYNVGNIYVTNSPATLEFVKCWLEWYPGPQGWREQAVFNLLARGNPAVEQIDDRYNSCRAGGTHVDGAFVEGFHGEGAVVQRMKLMRAFLRGNKSSKARTM